MQKLGLDMSWVVHRRFGIPLRDGLESGSDIQPGCLSVIVVATASHPMKATKRRMPNQWARPDYIVHEPRLRTCYESLFLKYELLTTVPWRRSYMVSPAPKNFSATVRAVESEIREVSGLFQLSKHFTGEGTVPHEKPLVRLTPARTVESRTASKA